MKLMIIGFARHGKDTVAEILHDEFGMTFQSSSWAAAEKVVRPYLAARGITYDSVEDCFEDRVNHRKHWADAINEYNRDDPARLAGEIYETSDIYVGIRSFTEYLAAKRYIDCTIAVDAYPRLDRKDSTFNIPLRMADLHVDNSGTPDDLRQQVFKLARQLELEPVA